MKDKKEFYKEVYEKYAYYKNKKKNKFFNKQIYKTSGFNITKLVASLIIVILGSGIVYAAGRYTYNKIWKEPETYNFWKDREITKEDEENAMSKEEAIARAEEIVKGLGYGEIEVTDAELIKHPSNNKIEWMISAQNDISIDIDAKTGKLTHISDFSTDDTAIKSTATKEKATEVAKNMYEVMGYEKGEYELSYIARNLITEDSSLWNADFNKIYDGIPNIYQCIRITFVPEVSKMIMLTIFDEPFENNPVVISKEEAIEIARAKDKELNKDEEVKNISAKLDIKQMNASIYAQEQDNKEKLEENNETEIRETDDIVSYRTEGIVRKVWNVEIEYDREFGNRKWYYVDSTTGEIIGGDSIK